MYNKILIDITMPEKDYGRRVWTLIVCARRSNAATIERAQSYAETLKIK